MLQLPPELRNQIYDYVAQSSKKIIVTGMDKVMTIPSPLSMACSQLREEFGSIHHSLSLAYATEILVFNTNFDLRSLSHSVQNVTCPVSGVERSMAFRINLTNSLQLSGLQTFVKELSECAVPPKTRNTIVYQVSFDPETFPYTIGDATSLGFTSFYSFHHCDGEQRTFEKIYWAFASNAEEVDDVGVKEYASGCWRTKGGRLCFI